MVNHRNLLIGLGLGAALGLLAGEFLGPVFPPLGLFIQYATEPIGKIFIRLLLMLVIPIVFSALVVGIAELDIAHLGRLGARTLGYTVFVSTLAVLIALGLTNWLEPGRGISTAALDEARSAITPSQVRSETSALELLVGIVPSNPIGAAANSDMLGFVFFSLFFGVGLALVKTEATRTLLAAISGVFEVCMRLIGLILRLAPVGVGALVFTMTARLGVEVLFQLAAYVAVVLLGLGLQLFGVYSVLLKLLARRSPAKFFRGIRAALATAFSTASSNATLPTALKVADENLKLPKSVSRFVLTAGATMNQNGTALFEGVTVLFIAQAYAIDLNLSQQLVVLAICVLAGVGTAGVPAGSLPVIAMILTLLGVPPEGIGLVLGVDRLLDMCRTTVNVAGDLVIAAVVAEGEKAEPAAS